MSNQSRLVRAEHQNIYRKGPIEIFGNTDFALMEFFLPRIPISFNIGSDDFSAVLNTIATGEACEVYSESGPISIFKYGDVLLLSEPNAGEIEGKIPCDMVKDAILAYLSYCKVNE